MDQNHLSAAEIAGFLDRTLDAEVRAHAVEHLSACERCRDEVAACARLATTIPAAKGSSVRWRAAVAVAAILVLAVGLRSNRSRHIPSGGERNLTGERSATMTTSIATVFPSDSVAIDGSHLRFVWKRDAGASSYRLTITDANGIPVYLIDEISDTSFTLPDTVRLTSSAVYFWHVDAPHADGSSAKSSSDSFRVAP